MADATDLKSVLAKARYGFESHHRHASKMALYEGKSLKCAIKSRCESLRTKTHEIAFYLPSIWQAAGRAPPGYVLVKRGIPASGTPTGPWKKKSFLTRKHRTRTTMTRCCGR